MRERLNDLLGHLLRASALAVGILALSATVLLRYRILYWHWVGLVALGSVAVALFVLVPPPKR